MKKRQHHFLAAFLLLADGPGAGTLQAAPPEAVRSRGDNTSGPTTVPSSAHSGLISIAVGFLHTMAFGVLGAPIISSQPVNLTVNAGESASFTVVASQASLTYQWCKDGTNINGARGATCSLGLAQVEQAGRYTVVVSNSAGSVTSSPAVLMVNTVSVPGKVLAWGDNLEGQTNVPPTAKSGITAIAAGGDYEGGHILAVKRDGSVLAWGRNDMGQATVPMEAQSGVRAIAAGTCHSLALKNNGSVVAWGDDWYDQTTVPLEAQSGVSAIVAGADHSVALRIDGSVVVWGFDYHDMLKVPPAAQSGVTAIAAGGDIILALKHDGSVISWGFDYYNQTNIPVAAQTGVKAIAAGDHHCAALKTNGAVVAWGENTAGQATVPIAAQGGVTAIAAGGGDDAGGHTVALKKDGTVVAWGYNAYGQRTGPAGSFGVTAVAAGGYNSVALLGFLASLQVITNGNKVVISWPTNAVGYKLQSTTALAPPGTWTDVKATPTLLGGKWTVTITLSNGARFYRLIRP